MNTYIHSVALDPSKCTGCTTCMKHCPTEAIRIRNGCAVIDSERCIDCGECIRNCPNNAKKSICNSFDEINKFKFKIALPAPALFAQFDNLDNIGYVLQGLLDIGFDDVFEVSKGAELVSAYTRLYLQTEGIKKPVIKCHGNSDALAFRNGIRQAMTAAQSNFTEQLEQDLALLKESADA